MRLVPHDHHVVALYQQQHREELAHLEHGVVRVQRKPLYHVVQRDRSDLGAVRKLRRLEIRKLRILNHLLRALNQKRPKRLGELEVYHLLNLVNVLHWSGPLFIDTAVCVVLDF